MPIILITDKKHYFMGISAQGNSLTYCAIPSMFTNTDGNCNSVECVLSVSST